MAPAAALAAIAISTLRAAPQTHPGLARVAPASIADLRAWDGRIDAMVRSGELRVRQVRDDAVLPGRTHERAEQYYRGVRVYGADVARQIAAGQTVSVFGVLYDGIDVDPSPRVGAAEAKAVLERLSGATLGEARTPELVVLPLPTDGRTGGSDQRYALTYAGAAFSERGLRLYFIDARTGLIVLERDDLHTQSVGRGHGVLGDEKKIAVRPSGGLFQAWDELRPPDLVSFDLKGNLGRTINLLNGFIFPQTTDIASDADNDWTDGAAVDAHVYAGWTYDYYYKRHGRSGLDNRNVQILTVVHPVRREDISRATLGVINTFYLNAFFCCGGILLFGEGLPPGFSVGATNQYADYQSGALDVVAHELSHGVTSYSARFVYFGESGALDEAFSDIMGTSVEFYFQTPGSGLRQADYAIGEDTWRPGGIRSMSDPGFWGDPDHYSRRFTGPQDNGGVHINNGIVNHAFYLAIEGGTNRTSGLAVQGVGAANREQIEKVFYRAFTQMLPAGANFSTARAATIQAARDLYGSGSPAERAVTQAWAAVGVS